MACHCQFWQFHNISRANEIHQYFDRPNNPNTRSIAGELNLHDLWVTPAGNWLFINTDLSSLATLGRPYL